MWWRWDRRWLRGPWRRESRTFLFVHISKKPVIPTESVEPRSGSTGEWRDLLVWRSGEREQQQVPRLRMAIDRTNRHASLGMTDCFCILAKYLHPLLN